MPSIYRGAPSQEQIPYRAKNVREQTQKRTYKGDFTTLFSQYGSTAIDDVDGETGFRCSSVELSGEPGMTGTLTVTYTGTPGADPIFEVDMIRVELDLRRHPIYGLSGAHPLDEDQRDLIEQALTGDKKARATVLADADANHLYSRLKNGQTHYPAYIPVVRVTTYTQDSPGSAGVGGIEDPPAEADAPEESQNSVPYIYVKTADHRIFQNNVWERREEWTGFEDVDTDIWGMT